MRQLGRMGLTLFWPTRGFKALLEAPQAWLALLVIIGSTVVAGGLQNARIDQPAMERLTAQRAAMAEPDKEMSESSLQEEATRALNAKRIVGYLVAGALPLGVVFFTALLFWLQLPKRSRWVGFKGSFAVGAHVWLPYAVRTLLSIPVLLGYPTIDPARSQGLFKTDLGSLLGAPQGALPLSLVDPFWIWMAVLFALAGRAAGWKRWHAVVAGVVMGLVFSLGGRALV